MKELETADFVMEPESVNSAMEGGLLPVRVVGELGYRGEGGLWPLADT